MACEHLHLIIEDGIDVGDDYARRYEEITCADCGAELIETRRGQLVPRKHTARQQGELFRRAA